MARKWYLPLFVCVAIATSVVALACGGTEYIEKEVIREVPKEIIVTQEVIKEVPVERIVTETIVKTVEVEKPVIVQQEVVKIKEVEVVKTVKVEVEKVIVATPTAFEAKAIDKASDGRYGGTLKTVSQASIGTIDPISSSAWVAWAVSTQIYDVPFASDGNFAIKPQMIDTWSISDDGLVWTFNNREGLTWHNGDAVTADDFEATLLRAFDSYSVGWKELGERSTVKVVDNDTWSLTFAEPFGLVFDAMNFNTEGFPIQKKSVIKDTPAERGGGVLTEHIGSGPYEFKEWDVGNRIVLDRYEGYNSRDDAPSGHAGAKYAFLDSIEYYEIPDVQTRLSMLETKEVDFIDTAPLDFFELMRDNKEINVYTDPIGRWPVMYLNHYHPPFNDVKARQALMASIDMGAIMAAYGAPSIQGLCPAVFICGLRWDTRVGEEFYNQNDIPRAKALLAESSYDGRSVRAMTPVDQPTIHPILTVSEQNIKAAGFDLDLQYVDWATLKSRRVKPDDWDIFTTWGAAANASPLTNNLGMGTLNGFSSDNITNLREKFFSATSEDDKKSLVDQMQMAYYEEVPYIRIGYFSGIHAAGVWVRGFDPRALWPGYWTVWLDR